jgi:hypothetical protein
MATAKKSVPKTVAGFRALHDPTVVVPNRIKAALEALAAEGPEHWEYEADFLTRAGVTPVQLNSYREQFAAHYVEAQESGRRTPVRAWFGTAKAAKAARGG